MRMAERLLLIALSPASFRSLTERSQIQGKLEILRFALVESSFIILSWWRELRMPLCASIYAWATMEGSRITPSSSSPETPPRLLPGGNDPLEYAPQGVDVALYLCTLQRNPLPHQRNAILDLNWSLATCSADLFSSRCGLSPFRSPPSPLWRKDLGKVLHGLIVLKGKQGFVILGACFFTLGLLLSFFGSSRARTLCRSLDPPSTLSGLVPPSPARAVDLLFFSALLAARYPEQLPIKAHELMIE